MYQIDNSTVATTMPQPTSPGTPGFFTDGNPATGTPATIFPAEFANALMMEGLNLLAAAGISPDKTKFDQWAGAIKTLAGSAVSDFSDSLGGAAFKDIGEGANQIPDMSSFASQQADRGYMKLPGGLIIQWGTNYSTSSASSSLSFPIAFPNACVHFSGSGMNASGNTHVNVTPNGKTLTSAIYSCFMAAGGVAPALVTTPNAVQFWWIAIGY